MLQDAHACALQVRNAQGVWVDAPPSPGVMTCNLGDMLRCVSTPPPALLTVLNSGSVWSNGAYEPTLHRVVHAAGERSRVSLPFFYEPEYTARVTPPAQLGAPRVTPVVYGEHLRSKVMSNFV